MKNIMEKARHVIDNVGELPQIPSVILNSLALLNNSSVTVKKIQEQILLDLYPSKGNKLIQNILWKHSISSGLFGKRIAEFLKKVNSEEAFISSLLHDIGKGVLLKNRTDTFENAVQKIYNEGLDSIKAEQDVFGFTHVEVGYLLMKNWGFSENIIETVIFHNNLEEYTGENMLVPIVSLANKLSHLHNFSFSAGNFELIELQILKISEEDLKGIVCQSVGEVEKYLESFVFSNAD
jgi:HD-like signal output (HDOD) protein